MKSKKNITVLLLLLVLTNSMIIADTYKKYDALDINNSSVGDSVMTSSGVYLPIIATFDPEITETYFVTSSQQENIGLVNNSSIQSYNTDVYDISTVNRSETFKLSYLNNLAKHKNTSVTIYNDQQFYSEDRSKSTGVSIDLEYEQLVSGNKIKLFGPTSGTDPNYLTEYTGQVLDSTTFVLKMQKGYHNTDLFNFYFSWTPTGIDEINSNSGYTFASGEKLVAYVFIEVEEN